MNSDIGLFGEALLPAWPLFAMAAVVGVGFLVYSVFRWRRLARAGMREVDRMTGREFEECLEFMFMRLGYRVERTPYQGDWGADLILARDGIKTAVQAKHRTTRRVGVDAVQEVVAAKAKYQCGATMVVTNRGYTRAAVTLAKANGVAMCDRDKLIDMLVKSNRDQTDNKPVIAATPSSRARCQECGEEVSEGVRAYCVDKSERFGGRILCMSHQRSAHEPRLRRSA